ncbi:PAAR-like protein [Streptobacillus felis]|uniref:PAAR-like protein n=1 Tax=Streptobacillus felis TaxID=1384509 RepID=UPI0008356019|nr:PAAR-like protein [Streptobacillus felis]
MELKKFEEIEITSDISNFFDKLADIFLIKTYNEINDVSFGRYELSRLKIEEKFPNTDFDYLVYTEEGHIMQDELVIIYFKELVDDLINIIDEFKEQEFYLDKSMKYINKNTEVEFNKIKSSNSNILNVSDYRLKNIKITLAGILSVAHVFGIKDLKEFLKEKKNIYLDKYNIPMTIYFKEFENYDINNLFVAEKEDVVLPIENIEDKKIIESIPNEEKKDFFGQDSKSDISTILDKLKDPEIIKLILDLINKKNSNKSNNDILNFGKDCFDGNENYEIPKKVIKSNENVNNQLKKKYESPEYDKNPSKYISNTTNREISKKDKEDINEILNKYEEVTQDENKVGDIVKQRGYDDFRDITKKNTKLFTEDMIYLILKNNRGEELEVLEKSLGGYSCRYINESNFSKLTSISKNIFLSKVSDMINLNLKNLGIKYEVDLSEYNYLNFGKKDVDEINVKGDKRILDYLILNNIVKKSYSVDSKGIRIYPRSRRVFDNILIKYLKNRIKYNKNFDGIDLRDKNLVRIIIIYLDELVEGLKENELEVFDEIGNKINITRIIIYLLKNKFKFSKTLLEKLNSLINYSYEEYIKDKTRDKDKMEILNIFPTRISLEKHCEIKKIRNIYIFYKSFYKEDENRVINSEVLATASVVVKCSQCPTPSKFVTGGINTFVKGDMILTENDKIILPFATCVATKVCSINIFGSKWDPVSNLKYGQSNALILNSKINCSFGGIISLESTYKKNVLNSKIEIIENKDKVDIKLNSPYKSKDELINFLNEKIFTFNFIEDCYDLKNNKVKFVKTLNIKMLELKKILEYFLKTKYVDKKIDFELAIFDENRIIDVSDIYQVINGYFSSIIGVSKNDKGNKIFKKYGKNINGSIFLKEYLLDKNNVEGKYEIEDTTKKNEPVWIKYLLKEYQKYKGRKRDVRLNEEFKRKITLYHKIGGGIDANSQTPWCSSFVNWILDISGIGSFKTPSSQEMISKLNRINKPLLGAILIYTKYDQNNNKTGHGHITFLMDISEDKKQYICLGGNQDREIKYSKYYIDKKMGVKGGYFKLNGIFWPPDYPSENILEIK